MDMGLVRGLITVALLVLFLGLCGWAWSRKRKKDFEEAAQLALDEEDRPAAARKKERSQ
jgi:cytochrome c oxidase cbb3-type subunit 4